MVQMSDEVTEEDGKDEVAAYYGLDLTKYRQDDEIGQEEEEAEPEEQQDEEQDEAAEAEEEPDESEEGEGEGDQPDPEPEDPKSDLVDKQLQKFQQLNATLEKKLAALPEDGQPTDKQVKEVEKAKSRIEQYLEESDDLDPYKGLVDIANEVKGDQSQLKKLSEQFEQLQRQVEESNTRIRAEQAQARFATAYPDLAGRYAEFAQKAHEAVVETVGDSWASLSPNDYERAANKFFLDLIQQEQAKAQPKEAEKEKPKSSAKKPKGSRIIKKKSGSSSKAGHDDPEAAMAAIRAKWES